MNVFLVITGKKLRQILCTILKMQGNFITKAQIEKRAISNCSYTICSSVVDNPQKRIVFRAKYAEMLVKLLYSKATVFTI